MKRLKIFGWFVALIIFGNSCKKGSLNNDCNSYPVPLDTYKYPILPGTPAWANFQTGPERMQACQIPDNILPDISTEGLVQSWLDFPLNNEIFMANSLQKATVYFIANFSGLRELVGRNDAADKLFKKYQSMNPTCVTIYQTDIEQAQFTFLFSYIELLSAQDTILNKMSLSQKKALMKEAMGKYYSRIAYIKYYGGGLMDLSLFICAKAMVNCKYQPFITQINSNLSWFINNAVFPIPLGDYSFEKNIIISQALNFIK